MKNILIIGDSCHDIYVYGRCERLCPDAPVPVFIPEKNILTEGMASNVNNNVKVLGGNTTLFTNKLQVTKKRYVDNKTNQMIIRVDEGEYNVKRVVNLDKVDFSLYDGVIISDYDKGFLFEEDIQYICENHNRVFIDTKKQIDTYCEKALFIKINEVEYNLSRKTIDKMDIEDSLIITLGSNGARYGDDMYYVEKVDIKDQTGAGDTFIASLVVKYLENKNIDEAIKFANKCSSWVVTQRGVTVIDKDKI